ncbi:MAG: tRNA pseudouridine(38-40) synthase TruA [Pseudomonadota bacterium]
MPRYKLTIEYDGTPFFGWQVQEDAPSVQGRLRAALADFCGEAVLPYGAGRTDRGVHATGQVAHIDLTRSFPPFVIRNALNNHLAPEPISILTVEEVDAQFDARFSAVQRHYVYRISNRPAFLALDRHRAWYVPQPLDDEAMHDAGQSLLGRHDFTTFRSARCQARSPVKRIDTITVQRDGHVINVSVSAPSFMHHQVRSIVGSLRLVGEGKWSRSDLEEALAARDRTRCGPVAVAAGLYFTRVDYDVGEEASANVSK